MKKVFIVHGFKGAPNGGWKPWLMEKLNEQKVYACALPMPNTDHPQCSEWVDVIARAISFSRDDDVFLVGHSLGVRAILRYLEEADKPIFGAVLISGRIGESPNKEVASFGGKDFNFKKIRKACAKFAIIHGDNDPYVPVQNARDLAKAVGGNLIIVKNGQHLNGSAGFDKLPQCLEELENMFAS